MLTSDARPVAPVDRARIAVVGARGAGCLLEVGRANRRRTRASLSQVALTGGRPADRPSRQERACRRAAAPAIALLAGIDDPVAAKADPVRGDTGRPLPRIPECAVGDVG